MKSTLILILTLIFLSFCVFFYKVYLSEKNYSNLQEVPSQNESRTTNNTSEELTPSIYSNYSEEIFKNALSENRVIVLFFTANWCSQCISPDEVNSKVFEDLLSKGFVGLRSHILDSETTTDLDSLAKKFDVKKENTIVFLDKKGAVVSKYVGEMDFDTLRTKLLEVGDLN